MFAQYIALVLYIFIVFPLTAVLIQQFRLIAQKKENGLQNYRKALLVIVSSHLLDALFIMSILGASLLEKHDLALWLMVGLPFFLVKTFVAFGAWLYYFLYKGSNMEFLSWSFWKNVDGE